MKLETLRGAKGVSDERAKWEAELRVNKRWVHACWNVGDLARVNRAIRSSVAAECTLRDQREHQIPISGSMFPEEHPDADESKLPVPILMARRVGLRTGGQEVRLESKRRLYALIMRRPDPNKAHALVIAIEAHNGLGDDNRPLCTRHGYRPDLPDWLPKPKRKSGRPANNAAPLDPPADDQESGSTPKPEAPEGDPLGITGGDTSNGGEAPPVTSAAGNEALAKSMMTPPLASDEDEDDEGNDRE